MRAAEPAARAESRAEPSKTIAGRRAAAAWRCSRAAAHRWRGVEVGARVLQAVWSARDAGDPGSGHQALAALQLLQLMAANHIHNPPREFQQVCWATRPPFQQSRLRPPEARAFSS